MNLDPINISKQGGFEASFKPTLELMSVEQINQLIAAEKRSVDSLITQRLHSEVVLINQLGHYIINSGGKRLRPILLLLSAKAFGYKGFNHIQLAAVVEFIHTATLLHDDVVDASHLRRGKDTANAIWGNEASVLVGDFLYSRAFQMMVECGNMRVMEILSEATNVIAEGEVMQLLNCHEPDTPEESYLEVIRYKTAKLFEAATKLGPLLANASEFDIESLGRYGMHLGTAFQLIDDVLDYNGNAEQIGKNVGDDLAEGKPTLPLIYTMRHGNPEQVALVRNAIEQGGKDNIDEIITAIKSTGALEYTEKAARKEAEEAINCIAHISESRYKRALISLAEFSVNRDH